MIDLRSDTVTRPSDAMRRAIAEAEVGDDTLGDDPTVRRLEERVAGILGKERALFFPGGIMANQTAILALSEPGTEVVVEASAHILDWEAGAPAALAGVQLRQVPTRDGLLTPDAVRAAIRPDSPFLHRTSLVCMENTHNAAGGRILPIEDMRDIREVAREHRLVVHLDGARLWNASAATGITMAEYAATADTVMVALSKGLGCPVGSLLAGEDDVVARAWLLRRRLGGSMRQSGLLAAAGLHALDHNLHRLPEDHHNASLLATLAADIDGISVLEPDTNIVMLDLDPSLPDAPTLAARLAELGVGMSVFSQRRLRAVTHLDVDEAGIRRAAAVLADVAARRAPG